MPWRLYQKRRKVLTENDSFGGGGGETTRSGQDTWTWSAPGWTCSLWMADMVHVIETLTGAGDGRAFGLKEQRSLWSKPSRGDDSGPSEENWKHWPWPPSLYLHGLGSLLVWELPGVCGNRHRNFYSSKYCCEILIVFYKIINLQWIGKNRQVFFTTEHLRSTALCDLPTALLLPFLSFSASSHWCICGSPSSSLNMPARHLTFAFPSAWSMLLPWNQTFLLFSSSSLFSSGKVRLSPYQKRCLWWLKYSSLITLSPYLALSFFL